MTPTIVIIHIVGIIIGIAFFAGVYRDFRQNTSMPRSMTVPTMVMIVILVGWLIIDLFVPII